MIAFILAVLARERDRIEAAFGQARVKSAHSLSCRAEEDCRLRLMEAKQVDDGMLDIRR